MAHKDGERQTPTYRANRGYHCLDCGYNLRGLANHECPECGRPFDPDDDRTYTVLAQSRFSRFFSNLFIGGESQQLIAHLPADEQMEIARKIGKCNRMKLLMAVWALVIIGAWASSKFLELHIFGFYLLIASFFFVSLPMRRIYGDELRRLNIRPARCPKCNYNLICIDAPSCPQCDTPLAEDPVPSDDA